jgi:hypothetical protein
MVVHLHIQLHHLVHIERFHSSASRHSNRVAHKRQRVMIFHKLRIFGEYRALVRRIAVGLQRHQSFFPRSPKQLVHHLQRLQVTCLAIFRTAEYAANSSSDRFHNVQWIRNQHRPHCCASADDQLRRLNQHLQIAVLHQVPGHHCAKHHQHPMITNISSRSSPCSG